MLPIAVYANNVHHSIPTVTHPMVDKRRAGEVFSTAFSIAFLAYVSLGLVVAVYFGANDSSSSNLDWDSYMGFFKVPLDQSIPLYAKSIKLYIILFPSLDVMSAYVSATFAIAVRLQPNLLSRVTAASAIPAGTP